MQSINRESGLQITLPEDYQVAPAATATPEASPSRRGRLGGARGAIPMPTAPDSASSNDLLVNAFKNQEMFLLDQLDLTPDASAPAKRARGERSGEAEFSVPLAADENAVLLLEQDGMYTWQLPEVAPAKSGPASRGARRGTGTTQATFRVALPQGTPSAAPSAAAARRGLIGNFVRDKIKAYVFKFAARAGVTGLVKFLERNARTGGRQPGRQRRRAMAIHQRSVRPTAARRPAGAHSVVHSWHLQQYRRRLWRVDRHALGREVFGGGPSEL
jgi:hypothetical protein